MPQVIAGQPEVSQFDSSDQQTDSHAAETHQSEYRPSSGRWVPKGLVLLLVLLVVGVVNACAYQINAEKYARKAATETQCALFTLDHGDEQSQGSLMEERVGASKYTYKLAAGFGSIGHPVLAGLDTVTVIEVPANYGADCYVVSNGSENIKEVSFRMYNGSSTHSSPCFWHAPRQARAGDDLDRSGWSHEADLAQMF